MTSPYSGLQAYRFWRHSIQTMDLHALDPVVSTRFKIEPSDRIATAGSCFAQHIARYLHKIGDNYFVTEDGVGLEAEERSTRQYGLFSARYGNIYTARQLWQLHQRAYGAFEPCDVCWQNSEGRWVDPFRQTIEPQGFESIDVLLADRASHFAAVRQLLERCDIFIFTLGLTEGWRSRRDGAVYPMAPGVVAGSYDPLEHEFFNASLEDTERDLTSFFEEVKSRNQSMKVLLTVSPVSLAATYEDRSVLVSTSYSKSVLRVAAENLVRRFEWIDYFPAFEVITGSPARGLYYEDDDREVNALGVAHVMRLFARHFISGRSGTQLVSAEVARTASATGAAGILCDEVLISPLG